MWIKICGNTNLEDAQFAAQAGADALGFVFAPSPRRVVPSLVRQITERLPRTVETYGVFVDAGFAKIVSTVAACGLTGVQLHRTADPHLASRLRQELPELSILGVMPYAGGDAEFQAQLTQLQQEGAVNAVLIDSSTPQAVGGTGTTFDWAGARTSLVAAATHLRLVAAGGLTPENVKEAIETLRPWGVDVVSGVELTRGKKDPARVLAFIQSAKQAVAGVEALFAGRTNL
jgi:phosphoribosylanthranilate isomerase